MSEEMKKDLESAIDALKGLDRQSLLLIQAGAQMLKARAEMGGEDDIAEKESA